MVDLKIVVSQYLPIRDVVFSTLREAILTGKLSPGERLMEKHLADSMGVSRTPVRESLRRLELEGLVVISPRRGAVVAEISKKDMHDLLVVRTVLEALGARLACQNMTQEHLSAIKKASLEFDKAIAEPKVTLVAQKDQAFHDAIFAASGNDKLVHLINNLRDQIYRFRVEYLKSEQYRKTISQEHRELLSALMDNDAARAENIAKTHIINQEINVSESMERGM